jgi:glyoxylase I family protein
VCQPTSFRAVPQLRASCQHPGRAGFFAACHFGDFGRILGLTAYQRFPGRAAIGDRAPAYKIRRLFFKSSSGGPMATTKVDYEAKREALKGAYLKPKQKRPATTARGIHHLALISSDIERTIKFYSEVLGFPLVELFENRDLASSTHWFHDLGHGNLLAFFDFPEDPMPPTRESVGGMHHVSISVRRDQFDRIRGELDKRAISYFGPDRVENSLYFKGPDGELLEIEADPLEVMEGRPLAQ